ncbi:MAG: hypothetical protein LLG06_02785 [Desulfobacteraceae bacterium]|nr:hypothetical protein [Desulfobacteraceae bacterium]
MGDLSNKLQAVAVLPASMAESVTRHALITDENKARNLITGIDSLDLGLYVQWGSSWVERLRMLDGFKQLAQKENGGLLVQMHPERQCLIHAGGKGNNYRFHLEYPGYHLFIAKAACGTKSPNVYVSFNSKALWMGDIEKNLSEIEEDLKTIGKGKIECIKCSRCDLTADFLIPGGLSSEFLQSHKVTRSRKSKSYLNGEELETFYAGDADGPVQLRIYNKTREIASNGKKDWFWQLWDVGPGTVVWRVEFQLRRPVLKEFGVNTLAELQEKAGGIWKYLTEKWFTLRFLDNESTERRTVHPIWKEVQACAGNFGPGMMLKRNIQGLGTASASWYLSHIYGCLVSVAPLLGCDSLPDTLKQVGALLNGRDKADFKVKRLKKAISFGLSGNGGAND